MTTRRAVVRAVANERVFWTGLAALIALVLSLPVFPSGDGAVHIYYSRILALLATGHAGVYAGVYAIRHLVQPYSLHYLWLIAGEQIMSVAWAEKSFVAAILLVNALGFRFLVRELGDRSGRIAPWILPLLLGWPLASGFFNFCFACGVLLFALGLCFNKEKVHTRRNLLLYVFALALLILSHPVPLLALILLLAGDLGLRWLMRHRTQDGHALRGEAFLLALALVAFVFPMLIADKSAVAGSLLHDLRPHLQQVQAMAGGYRLSMFSGGVAGGIFTAGLVAIAPVAAFLLIRSGVLRRIRNGGALPGERLWLLSWLLLAGTVIFPESMNGSALFADRMIPMLWPLLLAGIAALSVQPAAMRWSLHMAALWTAASLALGIAYLLPAAEMQQALTSAPLPRAARGLFVAPPEPRKPFSVHLQSTLLEWGGARAFSIHDDVLLNSPWMQLTIVPLMEHQGGGLLRDTLPGEVSESPVILDDLLLNGGADAARALAGAQFLLYSNPSASAETEQTAASRLVPKDWRCTASTSYAVCLRPRAQ